MKSWIVSHNVIIQIRNMVGTLLAAGNGKINQREIYEMLTIPGKKSWNFNVAPASSPGLWLTNVEYPADVLEKYVRSFEEITKDDETDTHENSIENDDDPNEIQLEKDNVQS